MKTLVNIISISKITFKDCFRNKLYISICLLGVLFSILNIGITSLFNWDLGKVSVEVGLSFSAVSSLVLIFYLGLRLFNQELDQKIIYLTISRPVDFAEYMVGKFIGISLILFVLIFVIFIFSSIVLIYFFTFYPSFIPPLFAWPKLVLAYLYQWISGVIVLSILLLWISFTKQAFVAVLLSFFSYLVGQNVYLLRSYLKTMNKEEFSFQIFSINIISYIFPNLSLFDLKQHAAYGLELHFNYIFSTLTYGICYIVLVLFLATYFLKRKELI